MANTKASALSSLLVSKKESDPPRPAHPGLAAAQTPSSPAYYKALTLKVDKTRFLKLKSLGVQKDLPSQALMTEALDLLFAKHRL